MKDYSEPRVKRLEITMLLVALAALGLVVLAAVFVALQVPNAAGRQAASESAMAAQAPVANDPTAGR